VKALRSDGQVVPSSASAALMLPNSSASWKARSASARSVRKRLGYQPSRLLSMPRPPLACRSRTFVWTRPARSPTDDDLVRGRDRGPAAGELTNIGPVCGQQRGLGSRHAETTQSGYGGQLDRSP
jgi:hypothetical protein